MSYNVVFFCNAIVLALMAMYIFEKERIRDISATHKQTGGQTLDTRVAFHARLSQHVTLGASQTVIFDDVITNIGSAYDFQNGYFTAPNDGVYFFASAFLSIAGSLHLQMMKNNDMISKGCATDGKSEAGAMNAIISLKRGDSVIVRHHAGSATEVIQGDWSFFTGYQVY